MLHVLYVPYMEDPSGASVSDNWFPSYSIKAVFRKLRDLVKEGYYFETYYIFTSFNPL